MITLLEKTQDTILGFLSFTSSTNYEQSVKEAYLEIFDYIRDYPHLHRVWNYIPNIHHCDPIERYQSFCVGRHDAFLAQGIDITTSPAASAVGKFSEPTEITFLAGKIPGVAIENPRQVSAYHYPKQYGPKSPVFSRALQVNDTLYISGTASVTGHQSMYPGDPYKQLEETVINLKSVMKGFEDSQKIFHVYVRNQNLKDIISPVLEKEFGMCTVMYQHAEICRKELLLEIEAICQRLPLSLPITNSSLVSHRASITGSPGPVTIRIPR